MCGNLCSRFCNRFSSFFSAIPSAIILFMMLYMITGYFYYRRYDIHGIEYSMSTPSQVIYIILTSLSLYSFYVASTTQAGFWTPYSPSYYIQRSITPLILREIYTKIISPSPPPSSPHASPNTPINTFPPHLFPRVDVKYISTPRFCRQCRIYKPDRTHHDYSSGHCVMKFDHFCIFINNSIGFNNYTCFIHFLLYSAIACIYLMGNFIYNNLFWLIIFPGKEERDVMYKAYWNHHSSISYSDGLKIPSSSHYDSAYFYQKIHIMLIVILTLCFTVVLLVFLYLHCRMISHNSTTIEWMEKNGKIRGGNLFVNHFDLRNAKKNWQTVWGNKMGNWIIPRGKDKWGKDVKLYEREGEGDGYNVLYNELMRCGVVYPLVNDEERWSYEAKHQRMINKKKDAPVSCTVFPLSFPESPDGYSLTPIIDYRHPQYHLYHIYNDLNVTITASQLSELREKWLGELEGRKKQIERMRKEEEEAKKRN